MSSDATSDASIVWHVMDAYEGDVARQLDACHHHRIPTPPPPPPHSIVERRLELMTSTLDELTSAVATKLCMLTQRIDDMDQRCARLIDAVDRLTATQQRLQRDVEAQMDVVRTLDIRVRYRSLRCEVPFAFQPNHEAGAPL